MINHYQACLAELGDGRFGLDLAATRVRRLGGRAHRDWNRKRSVFIDTVIVVFIDNMFGLYSILWLWFSTIL